MESNWKSLNIEWLFPAKWNYKQNDDDLLAKLMENIRRNDLIQNLIVRQVGNRWEVVNGNHRLLALQELGHPKVMCYDMGQISDADAKRIAIETNETRFNTDNAQLAEILKDLRDDFDISELCTTLPYSVGEVNNIIDLIDFDFNHLDPDVGPANLPTNDINKEVVIRISYALEDERILEELQKVVANYPSAVLK